MLNIDRVILVGAHNYLKPTYPSWWARLWLQLTAYDGPGNEEFMQRRRTAIGRGPFGRPVPFDRHATEVLGRIVSRQLPITEDAVFLFLYHVLRRNNQSQIFQKVRSSKDTGGYRYFSFSPDIDLLEVRPNGKVLGYELKGCLKSRGAWNVPSYYAGIDQALAMLKNPVASPLSGSFEGSVFDHVDVVHPAGSEIEKLADLLELCTPIGLITVSHQGTKELVKPKPNPFLNPDMKAYFLDRLETLDSYTKFRVNPVQ